MDAQWVIHAMSEYRKRNPHTLEEFEAMKAEILEALAEEQKEIEDRLEAEKKFGGHCLGMYICYHAGDEMILEPGTKTTKEAVVVGHLGRFVVWHWKDQAPTHLHILNDGLYEESYADHQQNA